MKKSATAIFILLISWACGKKDNTAPQPPGPPVFEGRIVSNVTYGSNTNWLGQTQQLAMDIYIPPVQNGKTKFPFVLFVHGGAFQKGTKTDNTNFVSMLASSGFVVASIDYRVGWAQDSTNYCDGDTTEAREAVYRALQDARASLRFIAAHASDYNIDTSWIFMSGESAGAVTTLYTTFVGPDKVNQVFPDLIPTLGPLDTDNSLTNKFKIKAIVPMWGALASPDLITSTNVVPALFFHGEADSIVPCGEGHYFNCPNMGMAYGSVPLYQKIISLGAPAIAHIDPTGDHGVYTVNYRTPNIVCFLNDVMAGQVTSMYDTHQSSNCP